MLREVEVKVLHENICGKMLSGYPWDRKTDTMLCAGGEDKVRKYKKRDSKHPPGCFSLYQ